MATLITIAFIPKERNDSRPDDPLSRVKEGTPVVKEDGVGNERVPTGTSTVPSFPKTIDLADGDEAKPDGKAEYQLVGLGIRTVSFLGIQVYVVGLYVATEDVADLQRALIRKLDPVATTLIRSEKDKLRSLLLDPERGEEIWTSILQDTQFRSALRIVPTRNTDFQHLRDGWVRGITARTQSASRAGSGTYEDEAFGLAVRDFKAIFSGGSRKSVPKTKTLLLIRDGAGALSVVYDDEVDKPLQLGRVQDRRIATLIWMGYFAGSKVASEGARKSVVDGVLEFVERPIGTVATQVN